MRKKILNLRSDIMQILARCNVIDPFRNMFHALEFETTVFCNRKCEYCPNANHERIGKEDGRLMPREIFEKLVCDLREINFRGLIAPHLYGEPLSDGRLLEWLFCLKTNIPKSTLKVVTNGDYLTKNVYDDLCRVGVSCIEISKHGESLTTAVVDLLASVARQRNSVPIRVLDYYSDYKKEQSMLTSRGGEIQLTKHKRLPRCCMYVTYPVINTYGDVILCCNDYHGQYVFGNIMKRSLGDIWFDRNNLRVRRRIYKGFFDLPLCQNCFI